MRSLKKTGTDFSSAQGMDPKKFFEVMGKSSRTIHLNSRYNDVIFILGLNEVIELDARAGGKAFEVV